MFAVNNYASAVCPNSVYEGKGNVEDVLQFSERDFIKNSYPKAGWRMMQYFGGYSQWEESDIGQKIETQKGKLQFILEVKEALNRIRNVSFHYASMRDTGSLAEDSILVRIFEKEKEGFGELVRKKYYTNNVPKFYSVKDIDTLMKQIYMKEKVLESQIPSFRSIFGRKNLIESVGSLIEREAYIELQKDTDIIKMYYNSLYFLLKEFYYNSFLQEEGLKERFLDALNEEEREETDRKRVLAINNLRNRINEYEKTSLNMQFGELCQSIMTDYYLQNSEKKVRNNRKDTLQNAKYEHFKMLLLTCLRRAFMKYVNEEVMGEKMGCAFLRKPVFQNRIDENTFCIGWKIKIYEDLNEDKYDAWMISWYIAGHFMTPSHINHLKGEIKCYLNYVEGIVKRKYSVMGKSSYAKEDIKISELKKQYKKILKILNLASEYCGKISAKWEDYYETEEEYAEIIKHYVAYETSESEESLRMQLCAFCNQKVENSPSGYIGIFYGPDNKPIVNRNVVVARMHGLERLIATCLKDDRVKEQEILDYYNKAKSLEAVFKSGKCKDISQEKAHRQYQQKKNRIELVDILKYSEILNDLMSQLISWCYLRERDRMYFQIGIHYIRLYFGEHIVDENSKLRVLRSKGVSDGIGRGINIIDGAVLYQLAAIYTYELPVYCLDKEGYAKVSKAAPVGTQTARGVIGFCNEYCENEDIYLAGLELFESGSEQKELIEFRNYIDHVKYLARRNVSILELYSKMYAHFFRHDMKLKKSVTVVLQNILARHFVLASLKMSYTENTVSAIIKDQTRQWTYRIPKIEIESMYSEVTVHKYEIPQKKGRVKKEKYKLDYYDQKFLDKLRKILEYNQG